MIGSSVETSKDWRMIGSSVEASKDWRMIGSSVEASKDWRMIGSSVEASKDWRMIGSSVETSKDWRMIGSSVETSKDWRMIGSSVEASKDWRMIGSSVETSKDWRMIGSSVEASKDWRMIGSSVEASKDWRMIGSSVETSKDWRMIGSSVETSKDWRMIGSSVETSKDWRMIGSSVETKEAEDNHKESPELSNLPNISKESKTEIFSGNKEEQIKRSNRDKEQVERDFCTNKSNQENESDESIGGKPATEHTIPKDVTIALENKIIESNSDLKFVNVSVVEMTLSDQDVHGENIIRKSVTANSDLISGVYEGGMKVWECTFDLISYFEDKDISFEGKTVLDLGCGAGLLGISALKRKAKEVHFQDYNSTVIEEITIPNTLVNCDSGDVNAGEAEEPTAKRKRKSEKGDLLSKCRFFSGEWVRFKKLMQDQMPPVKYDVILTSETIYNPSYYSALQDLFQHLLASNGNVYLASKSHYFGVGGGVHLFETFIKEGSLFHIRPLKTYDDGLQRMLLSLTFRDH
ncbi:histidine protein methyltransferase 1 homolog [Gastrophryne carolinensis]